MRNDAVGSGRGDAHNFQHYGGSGGTPFSWDIIYGTLISYLYIPRKQLDN